MANPISDNVNTGTIGELLVQIRLLQFGVQAAPPIKDSGNDLVAINGQKVCTIQIKTSKKGMPRPNSKKLLKREWDVLALVCLHTEDDHIHLDSSTILLIERCVYESGPNWQQSEWKFQINQAMVEEIWGKTVTS